MTALGRACASFGAALVLVGGATVVIGQTRNEPADAGSLAALTSELRQLRITVERLGQTQSQTQVLGVYLSLQQSRVLQTAARLDVTRKELDEVTARSGDLAARLADLEDALPSLADATKRAAVQDATRALKREQGAVSALEQQARNREIDLSQSMQAEEARWSELVSRLEAMLAR